MTPNQIQKEVRKLAESILRGSVPSPVPAADQLLGSAEATVGLANELGLLALERIHSRSPAVAASVFGMSEAKVSALAELKPNYAAASRSPFQFFRPALSEYALAHLLRRPDEPLTPVASSKYSYLNDQQTIEELAEFVATWFKTSQSLCAIDHVAATFFIGGPRWVAAVLSDQTNPAIAAMTRSQELTWRSRFEFDVLLSILENPGKPLPVSQASSVFRVKEMYIDC